MNSVELYIIVLELELELEHRSLEFSTMLRNYEVWIRSKVNLEDGEYYDYDDDANESISVTQIRNSCIRLSDMFVCCLVFKSLVSDHPLACRWHTIIPEIYLKISLVLRDLTSTKKKSWICQTQGKINSRDQKVQNRNRRIQFSSGQKRNNVLKMKKMSLNWNF